MLATKVAPDRTSLATRIGTTPILLAGAVSTAASSLVFLDIGVGADYKVILASRLLNGLGFALAYPTLNIQALTGVRDNEQGLASGLVGSSFQIGGAIVLAITAAGILAHTPAHATAAQTVHGFTTGVYVTTAAAGMLVLLALTGLITERRRTPDQQRPDIHGTVHFTPGARTAWQTHPNGQTIWVAEGVGLCQGGHRGSTRRRERQSCHLV